MIELLVHSFLWFSIPYLIVLLVEILGLTWNINLHGIQKVRDYDNSVFYIFWHENMLPVLFTHQFRGVGIIISPSRDGEIAARVCKLLGYRVFRGDSDSGGMKAVRDLIEYGNSGKEIAITPDGPRGPRRELKKGALVIARRIKIPVFTVEVKAYKCFRFSSWDRLVLPLPFSRIDIEFKGPVKKINRKNIEKKL